MRSPGHITVPPEMFRAAVVCGPTLEPARSFGVASSDIGVRPRPLGVLSVSVSGMPVWPGRRRPRALGWAFTHGYSHRSATST